MIPLIGLIVSGGSIGGLLLWLVGVVIAVAIVAYILKLFESPPLAYKILYAIVAVIALLIVISFFFGGSGGVIITR